MYQLGAWVRADVTDATSGPANPVASGPAMANTNTAGTFSQTVTGTDRIDGGASPDDLNGGRGDDFLDGGLHNDSLRGDDGRDTCISGETRRSSCEA